MLDTCVELTDSKVASSPTDCRIAFMKLSKAWNCANMRTTAERARDSQR